MDVPWKNLMSNTGPLRRNAQSCIRTSSPASRWWHGWSLCPNCLISLEIQPRWSGSLARLASGLSQAHQKYVCTVHLYAAYDTRPHEWRIIVAQWGKKPYRSKKMISRMSASDMSHGLVWCTHNLKRKSLWEWRNSRANLDFTFIHSLSRSSMNGFTLRMFILSPFFCVEPWLFHLYGLS